MKHSICINDTLNDADLYNRKWPSANYTQPKSPIMYPSDFVNPVVTGLADCLCAKALLENQFCRFAESQENGSLPNILRQAFYKVWATTKKAYMYGQWLPLLIYQVAPAEGFAQISKYFTAIFQYFPWGRGSLTGHMRVQGHKALCLIANNVKCLLTYG